MARTSQPGSVHHGSPQVNDTRFPLICPAVLRLRFTFIIFFILFLPADSQARDPFVGTIRVIDDQSGQHGLDIIRSGRKDTVQARAGDPLFIGDTVITGTRAKAQVELADRSLVNLAQESSFRVKSYFLSPKQAKRSYMLEILNGAVRFITAKSFRPYPGLPATFSWKESSIRLAFMKSVAVLQGTDCVVALDAGKPAPKAQIAVLDGRVSLSSMNPGAPEAVILAANQTAVVLEDAAPRPAELLQEQRESFTESTAPSEKPAGRDASGSGVEGGYTGGDMARDIAAGMSLSEAFRLAADSGMTVREMLYAALENEVNPYEATYIAVTDGYPAESVVQAAVAYGAPLEEVLAAALAGGADSKLVITAATEAGAPASAVASAIAATGASASPVYGNEDVPGRPFETGMRSLPLIGGGGGAPASTGTASPYRP